MTTDGTFLIDSLPFSTDTWSGWTAETLATARERDVPVLLLMLRRWSTPSREAAEAITAYGELQRWLREHVVAVVVDTDERPDVAARYGGTEVPTAQFLTPDGDPLAPVPSLEPQDLRAAGVALLEAWTRRRDDLMHEVESERVMRAAERATSAARRSPGTLTPAMLDVVLDVLAEADLAERNAAHVAAAIRLWRYAHLRRNTEGALEQALEAMRALLERERREDEVGAVPHSSADGGFAAVDQAALLTALAELAVVDDDVRDEVEEPAERLARFLIDVLGEPYGGFRHAASDVEAESADPRVFTRSAAKAARALVFAGAIFGKREWTERGRRGVDFLLERVRAGEAGFYHEWDGAPSGFGFLGDQAEALLAVLQAYEVSGTGSYLEHARRLVRIVDRDWREPGRGFRDLSELSESEVAEQGGLLGETLLPLDENVAMAEGLLWLARLTHDEHLLDMAVDTLATFGSGLEQRGVAGASYARAVDRMLSAEPEIKVVAEQPPGEPDRVADPLMEASLRLPLAGRTVQRLTMGVDDDLMYQVGLPRDGGRAAYVCIGSVCSAPLTQPEQLLSAAEEMIESPVG